ncbi:hypothetical protein BDW22DRAFT_7365 [Trametopsis cervina]|nr:hypothetical protein BDW22DRAFT_7365 [Trametopsis cervina]
MSVSFQNATYAVGAWVLYRTTAGFVGFANLTALVGLVIFLGAAPTLAFFAAAPTFAAAAAAAAAFAPTFAGGFFAFTGRTTSIFNPLLAPFPSFASFSFSFPLSFASKNGSSSPSSPSSPSSSVWWAARKFVVSPNNIPLPSNSPPTPTPTPTLVRGRCFFDGLASTSE